MRPDANLADRLRAEADRLTADDAPIRTIARRGRRRAAGRVAGKALTVVVVLAAAAGVGTFVTRPEDVAERAHLSPFGPDQEVLQEVPAPQPAAPGGENRGGGAGGGGMERVDSLTGTTTGGGAGSGGGTTSSSGDYASGAGGQGQQSISGAVPAATPRIIKTAELDLEVADGEFGRAFAEAERLAARYGGFVTGSATTSNPARSGDLTLRVPVERFESALADLRGLGTVETARVRGEDVSAEFVDLEARLRNLEAHEGVLLRLNREANTIAESLQVQRELQSVQLQIERLAGQLRVLTDQTSYGTISLRLHEAGEDPAEGEPGAWERAVDGAARVFDAIVVGLGYLAPIIALVALVWVAMRATRSRRAAAD